VGRDRPNVTPLTARPGAPVRELGLYSTLHGPRRLLADLRAPVVADSPLGMGD